ncbi:MAG: methylisocitrate lyase [Pseudomonadota bacterium]
MSENSSAGLRFRTALERETPLQIVGTINAYTAMMATSTGFNAIYLSGAGVANASYGLPDLGMTSLDNVLEDARRITGATATPLLVDVDTGWGGAFNIARMVREMTSAGVAAIHLEDQVGQKRCGHRPNKSLVSASEMTDRIKAAVDARTDDDFFIMARTDALAVEGMEPMLERIHRYQEAGADGIFAEAMTDIELYRRVTGTVEIPVLANLTEFGMTPLYTVDALREVGIRMALYPLSAFRAMNAAALAMFREIRQQGTQQARVEYMQTREELYEFLDYHAFEQKLDALFGAEADAQD